MGGDLRLVNKYHMLDAVGLPSKEAEPPLCTDKQGLFVLREQLGLVAGGKCLPTLCSKQSTQIWPRNKFALFTTCF